MKAFSCENLTYFYPQEHRPALKDINLCIGKGEFILVLGASGSGKSTLGKVLSGIIPEFYGGELFGHICLEMQSAGMVFQEPDTQLIMDRVEREIAFGLENMGVQYDEMKKRVCETIDFFDLLHLKDKKTYEISGGEKQKVVISSMVAMGHNFLVMDEPISQLDSYGAEQVISTIKKLNKEQGYTIVLIEHRADKWFEFVDRVLFMSEGQILFDGTAEEFVLWDNRNSVDFTPVVKKSNEQELLHNLQDHYYNLNENRDMKQGELHHNAGKQDVNYKEKAISLEQVYYTYRNGVEALRENNAVIYKGEVVGILGKNGCGKSTLLKVIAGLLPSQKGSISVNGKVGYLSQEPGDYLFNDTLYEELKYTVDNMDIHDYSVMNKLLEEFELLNYASNNPRDLSSGQRQRAALLSVLVMMPDVLVLDEPSRGLDRRLTNKLRQTIINQKCAGTTVIIATHDMELVYDVSDRFFVMSEGSIVEVDSCKQIRMPNLNSYLFKRSIEVTQ